MLQRMALCFLEVVTPVQRVEPDVEEEARPVRVAQQEGVVGEVGRVLGENQVGFRGREV